MTAFCFSHFLNQVKYIILCINPFLVNAPILYLLKTRKPKVFWCFQRVYKGIPEQTWVISTNLNLLVLWGGLEKLIFDLTYSRIKDFRMLPFKVGIGEIRHACMLE